MSVPVETTKFVPKKLTSYADTVEGSNRHYKKPVASEIETEVFQDAPSIIEEPRERKYELVLFAKYGFKDIQKRPSEEDIIAFFNNYGVVSHVSCPENKQFAIVYMTSIKTSAVHQKAFAVIGDIVNSMTEENKFHISIANARHGNHLKKASSEQANVASAKRPWSKQVTKTNNYGVKNRSNSSEVPPQRRIESEPVENRSRPRFRKVEN